MRKVIFLDRDGTINVEKDYLYKWEDFEFEKNAITGLKRLNDLGYELIVVTNQSGIARGYYTEEDLSLLNKKMCEELKRNGITILDCFYCPHHPEKGIGKYKKDCDCRKPNSGMLEKAYKKYNIDLKNSFMIGDKESDLKAGDKKGVTSILVKTGYGKNICEKIKSKYVVVEDLLEASLVIENISKID